MARMFRRGELSQALLVVLDSIGDAHGYAVMDELKQRVGGGWKPSPGAIYPALLKLVDRGQVRATEQDGVQVYSLTPDGLRAARSPDVIERWAALSARAADTEQRLTVGSLLDTFAASNPLRRRLTTTDQQREVELILARAVEDIEKQLDEGEDDG